MRKAFVIALVLLGLGAGPAAALEVKDIRSTYGPFGGVRPGNKFLPGDVLWLAFQVEGLAMDADSGLVKYKLTLEVFDSKDKPVFNAKPIEHQLWLSLGKSVLAERSQVVIGPDQAPGKYTVRMTITDKGGGKEKGGGPSKGFTYEFEVLPADFGLIHALSPSVAVTTQEFTALCKLVGMSRDAKQVPNVEVRLVVKDENGKPTLPKPFITNIKDIRPDKELGADFDIRKEKTIPMPFPLFLNRAGRYTIEIEAVDLLSKKSAKVSFPLQVLETSSLSAP
jgi:hypothetical protein